MKRTAPVLLLALSIALVGCGKDSSEPAGKATEQPTAEPAPADPGKGVGATSAAPPQQRMTEAEGQKLLTAAAAEGNKPDGDCDMIMQSVNAAAAAVGPTTPENQQAYLMAAICAERNQNYPLMLWAASALANANPESLKLGIIPRALMHLDRPDDSLAALRAINEKYPNEPGVLFAAMLLANDQNAWDKTLQLADGTIKALVASQFKSVAWEAEAMRARALLSTAKLDQVDASLARAKQLGAPPAALKSIARAMIPVRKTRMYVEAHVPPTIYLGTYHLYGRSKEVGQMFTVDIANLTGEDQSLKLEIEIPGVTDRITKTVNLLAGGNERMVVTPPLRADFEPGKQQAERTAQVVVELVTDDGRPIFQESIGTTLMPRDQLPLADNSFIPAWITPQAPEVEALLSTAKKRAPGGALAGKLAPTLPQMKALYDELKDRGMSYVLVTNFGLAEAQHTRLPATTIESTNALCLDGTVLFAALAEKLGLRPVLVRVPGHIFFGWHAETGDNAPPGTIFFLETTMVGSHSFEDAVKAGQEQFAKQKQLGAFETGQASIVDVLELRKRGITPQPWG